MLSFLWVMKFYIFITMETTDYVFNIEWANFKAIVSVENNDSSKKLFKVLITHPVKLGGTTVDFKYQNDELKYVSSSPKYNLDLSNEIIEAIKSH